MCCAGPGGACGVKHAARMAMAWHAMAEFRQARCRKTPWAESHRYASPSCQGFVCLSDSECFDTLLFRKNPPPPARPAPDPLGLAVCSGVRPTPPPPESPPHPFMMIIFSSSPHFHHYYYFHHHPISIIIQSTNIIPPKPSLFSSWELG